MGRSSTSYKKGQSGNPAGKPKGTTNIKTDLLVVYKKLFAEPIVKKDANGNIIKKIKLSPEQEIVAAMIKIYRDPKTPVQVRAKILGDLLGYLYTKPTQQIEMIADVEQTIRNNTADIKDNLDKLTPEQREAYMELCEKVNDDSDSE